MEVAPPTVYTVRILVIVHHVIPAISYMLIINATLLVLLDIILTQPQELVNLVLMTVILAVKEAHV